MLMFAQDAVIMENTMATNQSLQNQNVVNAFVVLVDTWS